MSVVVSEENLKACVRQLAVLLFSVAQILAPGFYVVTGIGQSIGARSPQSVAQYPEVPAPYAFAIWFLLFLLALVYAVHQALPSQRFNMLYQKIGWDTAGAFCAGTLWMLAAQALDYGWLLVFLILAMLVFSLRAFFGLLTYSYTENYLTPFPRVVMAPLLGVLSGWLSVAVFLNITAVFKQTVMPVYSPTLAALFTLAPAIGFAVWIINRCRGSVWYLSAVLWALVGIIAHNLAPGGNPIVIAAATLCIPGMILVTVLARNSVFTAPET